MAVALGLAASLAVLTFVFHFGVLRWLSGRFLRFAMSNSVRILVIVLAILTAHLLQVVIYANGFGLAENFFALARLEVATSKARSTTFISPS